MRVRGEGVAAPSNGLSSTRGVEVLCGTLPLLSSPLPSPSLSSPLPHDVSIAEAVMGYVIRDFVQSWYSDLSSDKEALGYIELVLTYAIGTFVQRAASVEPLRFLYEDVCEALRYHLKWYSEMLGRARRVRPGAFKLSAAGTQVPLLCAPPTPPLVGPC